MIIPRNKAMTTYPAEGERPSTVGTHRGKESGMNKEFKKIMDRAEEILKTHPDNRSQFLRGIEDAQEAQKTAAKAKEAAETEDAFNRACDDESHARDKEAFFRRQLERMEYTPRMEEEEYNGYVATITGTVEKAAADFRKTAEKLVDEIIAAQAAYIATATEADEVLVALDAAANILQSKYRYRIIHYQGAPDEKIEDRSEWTRHMIRYTRGGRVSAFDLAARSDGKLNKKVSSVWGLIDKI